MMSEPAGCEGMNGMMVVAFIMMTIMVILMLIGEL